MAQSRAPEADWRAPRHSWRYSHALRRPECTRESCRFDEAFERGFDEGVSIAKSAIPLNHNSLYGLISNSPLVEPLCTLTLSYGTDPNQYLDASLHLLNCGFVP